LTALPACLPASACSIHAPEASMQQYLAFGGEIATNHHNKIEKTMPSLLTRDFEPSVV
jgi:hypothetical protein